VAAQRYLVIGAYPALALRDVKQLPELPSKGKKLSLQSLLAAREAFLRIDDLGAGLDALIFMVFHRAEDAKAGAKVAEAVRLWALEQMHELLDHLEDAKDVRGAGEGAAVLKDLTKFLKAAQGALHKARCQSDDRTLSLKLKVPARGAAESMFFLLQMAPGTVVQYPPPPRGPEPAEMARLEQLAKALRQYHDKHGHFPPAATHGKDGKALLSWRVLLLPYLGEEKLYQQFKLDEPWDGPNNRKLIGKMPKVFRGCEAEGPTTCYQVFVGPGAAFEGKTGLRRADFKDDPARTILVAEATISVPWTKPEDLEYTPKRPLLNCGHYGRMQAVFLDGKARVVKGESQMPIGAFMGGPDDPGAWGEKNCLVRYQDALLHGLITRSGGEPAPPLLPAAGPGPEVIDAQPTSGRPVGGAAPAGTYPYERPAPGSANRSLQPMSGPLPTDFPRSPSTGSSKSR
jgi:hypothetical protein